MKEAAEFAESTQILMNVSEFTDVSAATDTLISAVQAFGYTAETSMDVVDLLNTIGNNYAISTADLAKSLTKSSASLVAAGGNLAEAAALTATANAIIQDADSVGTALKTTSLRLRGTSVKVLEEEGLDSDGAIESTSKLRSQVLATSGVDILTDTGAYKSTYQILLEIAEVWDQITDDKARAGLLELLAGKRNSSVIAALLQNPEDLKAAYKDAMNAEGSALKENEKYLDSIQGKIDQFNNAMQAMWSNTLDSDVVKFFVDLATQVIKLVDKVGLLGTALAGVFVYLTAFKQQTPLALLQQLWGVIANIGASIKANGVGRWIGSLLGVVPAMKAVTVETVANTVATQMNDAAKAKQMMSEMGLATATGTLSAAQRTQASTAILNAMSTGQLTMAQGNAMLAMLGYSGATMAADGSLKVLDATTKSFMATNPVGWILLVASAIAMVVVGLSQIPSKVEKLQKKLQDLQSELQDVQSELGSINSELKTTEERMAELLAKDSLSFVEQEELENLQKQNAELQRQLDLLEAKEKRTKASLAETFNETMDEDVNSDYRIVSEYDFSGDSKDIGWTGKDKGWSAWWRKMFLGDAYAQEEMSGKKYIDELLERYQSYQEELADVEQQIIDAGDDAKTVKKLEERKEKIESEMGDITSIIDKKTTSWESAAEGLDYGIDDKTDEWLDYINNTRDKIEIGLGSDNAVTNAITRIFDKDEYAEVADSIDTYVKALKGGDMSAKEEIDSIIRGNADLVADLQASGIKINDEINGAAEYFTAFASEANYATLEGKIKEVSKAATNFESLLKGGLFKVDGVDTGLADLFDEEGKIIQTKLSQVFQGTSDQTRAEITRLLEGSYDMIADDLDDAEINYLMNRMGLSFSRAILEIEKTSLETKNLELFPGLEDEISGIIDTFSELTSAVGSVVDAMDTLDKARAEEAYSGSMSLETLEALMQSTDNYADLIEVDETGAIKLATNAQEILVAQKLEAIKTNAELALKDAELAYEEALHTEQTYSQTGPAQEFMRGLWNEVGGAMAFVGSLWSDLTSGNWDGAWDRAKAAQEASVTAKETEYANKAAEASAAVAEAAKKVENAEKMNKIAQGLTPENVKARYSSEEASGGTNTEEEAEEKKIEDGWEKLINKYENRLALITNERDLIQAEIDRAEANGGQASKEMYDDLIRSQLEEKKLLEDKKAALEAYLEEHKDSIDPETWTEYNNEINATAVAIKEATTNVYEFAQALRDIDMHYFEQAIEEISRLAEEIDFVMSLFEDEDMSTESGEWTEAGITKINLMRDQMTAYAGLAKMWGDQLTRLENMEKGANGLYKFDEDTKDAIAADFQSMFDSGKIDKDTYDEYMEQLNEAWAAGGFSEEIYNEWVNSAEDGMHDAISAQKDVQDKLIAMNEERIDKIEEGINKEIEAYEDLIDAQKEELDAARELNDFRKQVANESKDIQELERRIASLSGSTAASDVAERRKLEAELMEKKEGLNNTYYDHAHDARSNALDNEVDAFTEAKNRYVENMREAAKDTEWVINEMITNGIFNADVANDFLLRIQETYNIPLSKELTDPWAEAATKAEEFKNKVGIIAGEDIPPYVTMISDDIRKKLATNDENNPWNQAIAMADKYADFLTDNEFSLDNKDMTTFEGQINSIISKWNSVKKAADDAYNAQNRTYDVGGDPNITDDNDDDDDNSGDVPPPQKTPLKSEIQPIAKDPSPTPTRPASPTRPTFKKVGDMWSGVGHTGVSIGKKAYNKALEIEGGDGIYYPFTNGNGYKGYIKKGEGYTVLGNGKMDIHSMKPLYQKYATGITGTPRDEWAITDEPQFGDELVLVPGKDGNLSFMRKGTGVVPADLTANLMEWGQFTPDSLNLGGGVNVNMINNAVNKPEFNFAFDALVKAENITEETLPAVKKLVTQELNRFTKELNYALKGKGAR